MLASTAAISARSAAAWVQGPMSEQGYSVRAHCLDLLRRPLLLHNGALHNPFLFGHRPIAEDVVTNIRLDALHIAPAILAAILQPKNTRSRVWRLTSWAMAAVNSPSVVTRASSSRICCSSASARFSAVISRATFDANHFSRLVEYRRNGQGNIDTPAILGKANRLVILDPLASPYSPQNLDFFRFQL
jgi:hypothetical protein